MIKYIALLRGINVGGNNKISMGELKTAYEKQGFKNVVTYINSGNVIFDSDLNEIAVKKICEETITTVFGFRILVCIISATEFKEALMNVPKWWNKASDSKHNAIFVISPGSTYEIIKEVGECKPEYEKVDYHGRVIFWSAPLKTFNHTRWSKILENKKVCNMITIRNANTTMKLTELIK